MAVYGQQLSEKVNKSIERLKAFEPAEGYHLAFSGGKDRCVLKWLEDKNIDGQQAMEGFEDYDY